MCLALALALAGPARGDGASSAPKGEKLLAEIARISDGTYTRVEDLTRITSPLPASAPLEVDGVVLENADTGARAERVELAPDGTFAALVPASPGANHVVVDMVLRDGKHVRETFELTFQDGAPEPSDPAQLEARKRLLAR